MNQQLYDAAVPMLSSILGNNTVAGLLAVVSVATKAITSTASTLQNQNFHQKAYAEYHQQANTQHTYQTQDQQHPQPPFQSALLSHLATMATIANTQFFNLTGSDTPLTTWILWTLLVYVTVRIVFGTARWFLRSVLSVVRSAVVVTLVAVFLWVIFNFTSSAVIDPESTSAPNTGHFHQQQQQQQHQHQRDPRQDPISQFLGSLQTKFRAEYQRQQQHVQQQHVY